MFFFKIFETEPIPDDPTIVKGISENCVTLSNGHPAWQVAYISALWWEKQGLIHNKTTKGSHVESYGQLLMVPTISNDCQLGRTRKAEPRTPRWLNPTIERYQPSTSIKHLGPEISPGYHENGEVNVMYLIPAFGNNYPGV